MANLYLERHDPVKRAERVLAKPVQLASRRENQTGRKQGRVHVRARVKHEVAARDSGQCTVILPAGNRCDQKRFLEMHHHVLIADGGSNESENLTSLCSSHHKRQHELMV